MSRVISLIISLTKDCILPLRLYLLSIRWVKLVIKKEFAIVAVHLDDKIFVIYIALLFTSTDLDIDVF